MVRDPIHGFVRLDRFDFVKKIVTTAEFQRLHSIAQLGVSRLVYPSATHTRFSHSLGVMRIVERILDNLILAGDVKGDEADNLLKVGMAAGLLHDIGHGPLSHCSESFFEFKHEKISAEIIRRSPISDILEGEDISPDRVVHILQRTSAGTDKLLSQLVNSELDADRLDYLTRDSYFAGVGFGNVDLERIVNLLRLFKGPEPLGGHAVTPIKGKSSIESYIVGRHHMYQAVYFHHTTRGVERLVAKVFQRAREKIANLDVPDSMDFLDGDNPPSCDQILGMDDHTILWTMARWRHARDGKLRSLCKRFFQRNLLKSIELDEKQTAAYIAGIDVKIRRLARANGLDPEYFCPVDTSIETPYTIYSIEPRDDKPTVMTNVFLYRGDGSPVEISQASDIVRSLSQPKYLTRLYMPREMLSEATALFA